MLNIIYSNRYEVLRQCLIENLKIDYGKGDPLFSPLQVIVPSDAVSDDLLRTIVDHSDAKGVCMGLKMQWINEWMKPYGNLWLGKGEISKTLEWMIWDILDRGEFDREEFGRLAHYLNVESKHLQEGLSGLDTRTKVAASNTYELAIRIAAVFTKYINYRYDWVSAWLGEGDVSDNSVSSRLKEQRELRDKHDDAIWQKALWEKVRNRLNLTASVKAVSELEAEEARGENLIDLVRRIPEQLKNLGSSDNRALHFFMPQVLPPLALPFLAKEASQRDVWLYLMNPCTAYWFGADGSWFGTQYDVVSGNEFLHRNAASSRALIDRIWRFAPEDAYQEIPLNEDAAEDKAHSVYIINKAPRKIPWHDLTETKAFPSIYQTVRQESAETNFVNSHMIYIERKGRTLLDRIANSILYDEPLKMEGRQFDGEKDKSLRILKASGFVRQVEVVIDWIHACRRDDSALKPEEILVVTPQIDEVAPLIEGVMASQPEKQKIAYRIVGRTELAINSVAASILKVGRLIHSILSASVFSEMLALPLITVSWELSLVDIQIISRWLAAAGFRYGIDDDHLDLLAVDGQVSKLAGRSDGTLERAMERLVLGRLTPEGHYQPYGDVLPVYGNENSGFDTVSDTEGAERLDVLTNIYIALKTLYGRVFGLHTSEEWSQWTEDLLEKLFPVAKDQKETLEEIVAFQKKLVVETEIMSATLGNREIPFEVFWMALEKGFVESRRRQKIDGSVIFAGMQDFRGLPFKVIAMIGMDDGPVFPGVNRTEEFDLTQPSEGMNDDEKSLVRRKGDRDSREDNRNVFLDLLLAAQDRLLITYDAGAEPDSDKSLNPSIVVQDLQFWLEESGVDLKNITDVIPLTRYSSRNLWRNGEKDAVRYFRTCDRQVKQAVEAEGKMSEESFSEGSKPLYTLFFSTSLEQCILPFFTLADVWCRPDAVIRKAVGMADIEWLEADRTPQIQMPEDRLFRSLLERRILDRLRKEESLDFLVHDPRMGCQDIRQDLLEPIEETMQHVNDLLQSLDGESVAVSILSAVQIQVDGIEVQIPVPEVEHCCGGEYGQEGYLQVVANSRERTTAWLLHLLLSASEKPLPMYVVSWSKDTSEIKRLPILPSREARQVLAAICQLVKKVMYDKVVFPNHYASGFAGGLDRPRFNPFWRHDEAWQDEQRKRKSDADSMLEELMMAEVLVKRPEDDSEKKKQRKSRKDKLMVSELCGKLCQQIQILMETHIGQENINAAAQ